MSISSFDLVKQFKKKPLDQRQIECDDILRKFPDRIPILVCCNKVGSFENDLDRIKYLVPSDLTFGQFCYVIRKRLKLKPEIAIFINVGKFIPPTSALLSSIYNNHKDDDGFIYCIFSKENTFG
jgi:GABA(A) receptor-associated protein